MGYGHIHTQKTIKTYMDFVFNWKFKDIWFHWNKTNGNISTADLQSMFMQYIILSFIIIKTQQISCIHLKICIFHIYFVYLDLFLSLFLPSFPFFLSSYLSTYLASFYHLSPHIHIYIQYLWRLLNAELRMKDHESQKF